MTESTEQDERLSDDEEDRELTSSQGGIVAGSVRLSRWKLWLALSVMFAAASFAGSREPWALAAVGILVGLNVALVPRRVRAPGRLCLLLAAFALWPLLGFVPLSSSSIPDWRLRFESDFEVPLSHLRSAQPWITLESWSLLLIGVIWTWHCMGRGFSELERRWLVRRAAVFVALLATAAIIVSKQRLTVPFWRGEWQFFYFGPFPNRNNFGGYLAMGAVLAFAAAYDAHRRRSPAWLLYALCVVPMFWAILMNTSRAGVVLFFLALTVWMSFASFSKRSARRMGIAAAVLLMFSAGFLLFGRDLLKRFDFLADPSTSLNSSGRIQIFSDAIEMIKRAPFAGVGLGGFDPAFTLQKSYSDHYTHTIHPENDWLWLASEAGIPAALAALAALFLYVRRTGPWKHTHESTGRKDRRLRNACTVAALILPLNGLVDTPAHQPGVIFGVILIAAISMRPRRNKAEPAPADRLLSLGAAGLCFLAGFNWLATSFGIPALPGKSAARMWERRGRALDAQGDLAGAREALSRAIANKPLDWNLYYERATAGIALNLPPQTILEDFARARYLEPHSGLICLGEAELWAPRHPRYALQAVREGMRRDQSRVYQFYNGALQILQKHPELRTSVLDLAGDARMKLAYLGLVSGADFAEGLASLLESQPELETLDRDERLKLFRLWYERGDKARLIDALDRNVAWRQDGWPVLAQASADKGDLQHACEIAMDNISAPAEAALHRGGDISQLQRAAFLHPTDYTYWFELFEAQKKKNLTDDALATLDRIAQLPNPPPEIAYEQGIMFQRKGDYAKAWEKLRSFASSTRH